MLPRGLLRGFVLPAAECLTRTRFWTYYKESLRFDRWDEERRTRVRSSRLAAVWNAALGTTLHRQRLHEAGLPQTLLHPDEVVALLRRLPAARKPTYRGHFPAGVTCGDTSEDWRYFSTAGTTDRMTVIADFRKRDHARSSELRAIHLGLGTEVGVPTVEIPPNACNVVCGIVDTGPASLLGYLWQAVRHGTVFSREALTELRGRFERQFVLHTHTLPPLEPMPAAQLVETLDRYLARLADLQPVHLRGFPVYLLWLADRCAERGVSPAGLRMAGPYGGLASPRMAERIASGLGCRFLQKYGTSELGVVAASCGRSPGMHLFDDLFLIELLRQGQPVPPGELGRVVVTDLTNTAMPLIRYDVGDVALLHTGPCPCGRQTPRLEVVGRIHETIATPHGLLTARDAADIFFADLGISNFRIEEVAPGSFDAAVVARPGRAPQLERCREQFAARHGGLRRLRIRTVPYIQPETSGKYRFILPWSGGSDPL